MKKEKMDKDDKNTAIPEDKDTMQDSELDLDDLELVSGGSLIDVQYTETTDISDGTKKKV